MKNTDSLNGFKYSALGTRGFVPNVYHTLSLTLDNLRDAKDPLSVGSPSYPKVAHINLLNAELNPVCHLLALLAAHHILHLRRIRVNARLRPGSWYNHYG